jgi:hypothetical protein
VLREAGLDPLLYESHVQMWWRNPSNPDSLRLTRFGVTFFENTIKLPTYKVTLQEAGYKSKHLLQLEKLFTAPYFLKNESIIVFSDTDAVMLQLHAGNLGQYLDNLQSNS